MFANLSPGAIGVRATMDEAVDLAAKHGFKGIDINLGEVESRGVGATMDLLAARGIRPGGWGLPTEFRLDDAVFARQIADLPRWARVAAEIGATRCATWVPSGSHTLPFAENFRILRNRFRDVAMILKDHGCRLGLEFIGPETFLRTFEHPFIHTLDGMLEMCDAVGTGNVGLLLDAWHWYTSGGTIADLEKLRPEQVVYVHVNDAPAGIPREEQVDNVRRLPMETGVIDLPGFLRVLGKIGYDGPITPEPFSEKLRAMAPDEATGTVAQGMRKAWDAAGMKW